MTDTECCNWRRPKYKAPTGLSPIGDHEAYAAWQSINYNLAVVRRYLTSDVPDYLAAADLRMMLYGPQDLFWNYFQVRKLAPDSEKQQIIYLEEHDPQFLAQFKYFLTEQDRHEKFRRYEALATTVLAPVGQLWQAGEVVLNLDAEAVTPKLELYALDFWESLVLS
ncbi:MAG: hypothetical protein R2932_06345 [Caldilineaceae bacterium]